MTEDPAVAEPHERPDERPGRPARPESLVGTAYHGYRLLALLGVGASGAVYRAQREGAGQVALKLLERKSALDPLRIAQFLRTGVAVQQLEHDNIVRVFDVGLDEGTCYVAMELLEGGTLGDLLHKRGPLDELWARAMGIAILSGLAHAHDRGAVHRDIKPENIMLDADGVPKIADFGIVGILGTSDDRLQRAGGHLFGTPSYMAPEVIQGGAMDARSDLYSCGVMLYEMVTGTVPFVKPTRTAVLVAHVNETPRPPSALADVSAEFEAVVLRLLEKRPERRLWRAREVVMMLEAPWGDKAP